MTNDSPLPSSPRYPRLTLLMLVGIVLLAIAAILTVTHVADPVLSFRVGVVGYLLLLAGGAGYITLRIAAGIDTR